MKRKRIDFKSMDYNAFKEYLNKRDVPFNQIETTTVMGALVCKIIPNGRNLKPKVFDKSLGTQMDPATQLTDIDMGVKRDINALVKIIDTKINNMSTKGVYHPRRLLPKWQRLKSNRERLALFTNYMKAPMASIGFTRLIKVNLPQKTLESIIIEHPEYESIIDVDNVRFKCIDKFKMYENGRTYLQAKGLI